MRASPPAGAGWRPQAVGSRGGRPGIPGRGERTRESRTTDPQSTEVTRVRTKGEGTHEGHETGSLSAVPAVVLPSPAFRKVPMRRPKIMRMRLGASLLVALAGLLGSVQ